MVSKSQKIKGAICWTKLWATVTVMVSSVYPSNLFPRWTIVFNHTVRSLFNDQKNGEYVV